MSKPSPDKSSTGCYTRQALEVKFGVPLTEALKDDCLPIPLVDLLVYIAQEGVTTTDLFRRPGNPNDAKLIMKRLAEGREVVFPDYNFYTLASVVKKFLIKLPEGVFGPDVERELLEVLHMEERVEQHEQIRRILLSLTPATQQLLALLFGTWFRIVNRSEFNTMSSEAVAKSVAGSLFHTCADDPQKVEKAVQVLQILIDDFGVSNMIGRKNIQYFADMTRTGIRVKEKFRYEYQYPVDDEVPYAKSLRLFALLLQKEAERFGFSLDRDAITEEEFYGPSGRPRANTKGSGQSNLDLRLPSSPPSPQSLQPGPTYQEGDQEYNPHRKLTQTSSLSAPEVNKGYSPTQDHLTAAKRMYQSSSLSRFDNVRRRQIMRMKKRSNWFLAPNTSSQESGSGLGSHDASMGKSSVDGTSSDALMSDITASDGGMSDTLHSDALRLSCDMDGSYLTDHYKPVSSSTPMDPSHRPSLPQPIQQPDIVNGNHAASSSLGSSQHTDCSSQQSTPSHPRNVSDREVRYFMVENWYGTPRTSQS